MAYCGGVFHKPKEWNMDLVCVTFPVIVGVIIFLSIPSHITPIQRKAQESKLFRWALTMSIGTLAMTITYLILLYPLITLFVSNAKYFDILPTEQVVSDSVVQELWVRHILSSVFPNRCFLGDGFACNMATQLQQADIIAWHGYMFLCMFSFFPAFVTVGIVRFTTYDSRKQKRG
jgi:hypothetical protein